MSSLPASAEHARHDRLLVVRHAAGDLDDPAEVRAAAALVAACDACAALGTELATIAGAVAAMPAPVRPRDLRLSADQLRAARPGGLARLLGRIGGLRAPALQPFAGAVAVAGIVLAVAGGLAPTAPVPAAPVPEQAEVTVRRAAAASPAPVEVAGTTMAATSADPAADAVSADTTAEAKVMAAPAEVPTPALGGLLAVVGALLAAGAIVVLVLVRLARRTVDPLLR